MALPRCPPRPLSQILTTQNSLPGKGAQLRGGNNFNGGGSPSYDAGGNPVVKGNETSSAVDRKADEIDIGKLGEGMPVRTGKSAVSARVTSSGQNSCPVARRNARRMGSACSGLPKLRG